jgi:DNA-binding NarL/FixJ family response regulator
MAAASGEVPELSAPSGLTAWCLDIGGPEFALFELPSDPGTNAAIEACLTVAEAEVARSMVAGLSNAEIAAWRNTSSRTVANQAASIFRKLHIGSRRELAAVVSRRGANTRRGVP